MGVHVPALRIRIYRPGRQLDFSIGAQGLALDEGSRRLTVGEPEASKEITCDGVTTHEAYIHNAHAAKSNQANK
jgi:hypothetical protein